MTQTPVATEKPKQYAQVRYDAETHAQLKEFADLKGMKLHRCLEEAVSEYIDKHVK